MPCTRRRVRVLCVILKAHEDNYYGQKNPISISSDAQGYGVAIRVLCLPRRAAVQRR